VPRSRRIVLLALILAVALPVGVARADGPKTPFVVARGHSLFGAPWQIRFGEEPGYGGGPAHATFLFSVGDRAEQEECDCGYYSSIPLPVVRAFTFDPTFGSEFDRFEESDMSGAAGPRVRRIALTMSDGSVLEAELLPAPTRLIKRHPRLRPIRFFDLFFPNTDEPISVAGYGAQGKLLQKYALGGSR
jgi:hypothetical protein